MNPLLFILFSQTASWFTVIQGQYDWGVTYSSTEICALKGSTVDMSCTYRYPSTVKRVENKFWFTKESNGVYVDLRTDPEYSGRVQYNCGNNDCTLRITDLRESDSSEYKFRFITTQPEWKYTGSPGVTLRVTDLQVQVSTSVTYTYSYQAELKCHSSCLLPGRLRYVWYKNGQIIQGQTSDSYYSDSFTPTISFSCAVEGHENSRSPPLYAPQLPSVSVSPSAEIVEGSSVTLTCSSDANPAANYTWYKKNGDPDLQPLSKEPQLVFSSIQSSDSGEYYCTAENELGTRTSEYISIDVTYAPRLPSVSVSPSAEIVEGSSVTLTCSSDANPAANYTWYKENYKLLQSPEGSYYFTSISSEDGGNYSCKAQNQYGQNSSSLFIDVQYAPRLPSVSVSPSAEIVEGSSVTLTCSSDANPAANYTWYKENEDSPKASGQIFTITDIRAEHSGNYYCEAQNRRGRHNATLQLIVTIMKCNLNTVTEKHSVSQTFQITTEAEQDDLHYASVRFSKSQTDPVYSNIRPAGHHRHKEGEEEEEVEYTAVKFTSASAAPRSRGPETGEDSSALYSTVNTQNR
ncbi:B-cell receptor CD22-like [Pagrus major]|uniref:B-cell receptor CD22-like n=1 Tax=Pagrus major TaxID=143350 RepID=UPI003CC894B1